jgi:hypothetical protein
VPRMRAFRDGLRERADLWAGSTVTDGVVFTASLPPGPERQARVAELQQELEGQAAGLTPAVDELRELVGGHEPVELIMSVALPTSLAFDPRGPRPDDAAETVTWPAKLEYLLGVALSLPPGSGSTPHEVTDLVMAVIDDIFDAAIAKTMVDSFAQDQPASDRLDEAVFMLRQEHIFDRMPGYAMHLEEIDAEVFERHRRFYLDRLGFSPGDVARAVRRLTAAHNRRLDAAFRRGKSAHGRDEQEVIFATLEMVKLLESSRRWSVDEVAGAVGIALEELRAMLSFFSTRFGAQPEFRLPSDKNLARTRPCVELDDDVFLVADPWSLLAAVHARLAEAAAAEPSQGLSRYRSHREAGHQRLVGGAMRRLFGDRNTWETQHYESDAEGPGEIDVLVTADCPIVVEAKAHTLTDAGRRGAPMRVSRVAGDVIRGAIKQTRRARAYILDEGGRSFASRQGAEPEERLRSPAHAVGEIVVTFERMDPLVMHGPELVGQRGRPVWIVCLADLLMIRDILTDPAAFHHYARVRASMAAGGPLVLMESDALGSYLIDRIAPQRRKAEQDPEVSVLLGYASGAINAYFTALELGRPIGRPSTGVPAPVAATLATTVSTASCWSSAVDAVMEADGRTWRRWKSFARRHRSGVFQLTPGVRLSLGAPDLLCAEDSSELRVAPRR